MEGNENAVSREERIGALVAAVVLVIWGLFWMAASTQIRHLADLKPINLSFLPFWSGALLVLTGAGLLVRSWGLPSRPAGEPGQTRLFELGPQSRVLAVMLALLAYIALLPSVHYFISTFFLLAVGLALSGEPTRPRLVVVAAAMSAALFGIFLLWLGVPLPGSRFG